MPSKPPWRAGVLSIPAFSNHGRAGFGLTDLCPASKTLEVAQELYDGQGKKIITYPRVEVRYLPESSISAS